MPRRPAAVLCFLVALLAAFSGGFVSPAAAADGPLVVYSGRSKSFMDKVFDDFTRDTGVEVRRVYGKTAQIALKLQAEGKRSPADVVLAQDAGALGALSQAGLLAPLEADLLSGVDPRYVSAERDWVATSLRARTLAYSTLRVDAAELPASVFDLTGEGFKGRVGWAPGNASFQAFVTALRTVHGDDAARAWLTGMRDNGAKAYPKNTAIIEAIAAGEVDFGLPNHYYLLRFTSADPEYPVAQTGFSAAGDTGNMVNVAGAGVLKTSRHPENARRLVAYLLGRGTQTYFTQRLHEYPVSGGGGVPGVENQPELDLNTLNDLPGTLEMLQDAGLL